MMNRFVIIAEIRSGYQLLATSLHSHPKCACFGEIFGSDKTVRGLSLRKQPIPPIELKENPIHYLNNKVYPVNEHAKAIGFKLNYVCARSPKWKVLWEHIRDDGWKIIHLTRKNLLDRILSQKLAIQENTWQMSHYKSTVNITLKDLDRCTKRSLKWQQETRDFFNGCPVYELEYNDIFTSFEKVQQFLGLEPEQLHSSMIRQRKGDQGKFIGNYKQLMKDCINQQKYVEFLTDIPML